MRRPVAVAVRRVALRDVCPPRADLAARFVRAVRAAPARTLPPVALRRAPRAVFVLPPARRAAMRLVPRREVPRAVRAAARRAPAVRRVPRPAVPPRRAPALPSCCEVARLLDVDCRGMCFPC